MKNKLLILLGLFFVITLQAQKGLSKDYSYTVSKPYQVEDAAMKFYFNKDRQILSVKAWNKFVVIQKFDVETLKQTYSKKNEDFPKNFVTEGMIEAQGKYYFFYSSWTGRKTKHEQLFSREIDFETGKFIGEPVKIIDVDGKVTGTASRSNTANSMSFGGMGVADKFQIYNSKDESKVLIKYRKKPKVKNDKKSKDIIGINVYDISLTKLWSKEYTMPYTERKMDAMDFAVDTNGFGYMMAKVFHDDSGKSKKKKKDTKANYHMELFRMHDGSVDIEKTKIAAGENFINDITLYESETNGMVCAGFYNNGKGKKNKTRKGVIGLSSRITFKSPSADGVFVCKLSKDGSVISQNTYEIPLEILNQYVSKRTKKKNGKKDDEGLAEFESLVLKDLVFEKDGGLTLIGEQMYSVRTKKKYGYSFSFFYNDMLISKISPSGELSWMKKIPKRQFGKPKMGEVFDGSKTYQGGMSYSYFHTNGNHYLVYLDNVKNINLSLDKIPALHTDGMGGYLTAYKVNDATGNVSKGSILDTRKVKAKLAVHQFSNNRVVKTAEDEFVVEVYKKKKEDVLIKVKIKG